MTAIGSSMVVSTAITALIGFTLEFLKNVGVLPHPKYDRHPAKFDPALRDEILDAQIAEEEEEMASLKKKEEELDFEDDGEDKIEEKNEEKI